MSYLLNAKVAGKNFEPRWEIVRDVCAILGIKFEVYGEQPLDVNNFYGRYVWFKVETRGGRTARA